MSDFHPVLLSSLVLFFIIHYPFALSCYLFICILVLFVFIIILAILSRPKSNGGCKAGHKAGPRQANLLVRMPQYAPFFPAGPVCPFEAHQAYERLAWPPSLRQGGHHHDPCRHVDCTMSLPNRPRRW